MKIIFQTFVFGFKPSIFRGGGKGGGGVQPGLRNPPWAAGLSDRLLQDKQAIDRLSVMLAKFQRLQVGWQDEDGPMGC